MRAEHTGWGRGGALPAKTRRRRRGLSVLPKAPVPPARAASSLFRGQGLPRASVARGRARTRLQTGSAPPQPGPESPYKEREASAGIETYKVVS